MSRSSLAIGLFVGGVVLASVLAPTPMSKSLLAEQRWSGSSGGSGSGESPACEGLRTAYLACVENNGAAEGCGHIREQLFAHGCFVPSGSSR